MNIVENNKNLAAITKDTNIPMFLDAEALCGLVHRIAGKNYSDKIKFLQISPKQQGMDHYVISDGKQKIIPYIFIKPIDKALLSV